MKKSEIGLHYHGVSGTFVERIIDGKGREAAILEFPKADVEVIEHIMDDHMDDSPDLRIEKVITGESSSTKFIFSSKGIDTIPLHVTGQAKKEGSPWRSEN